MAKRIRNEVKYIIYRRLTRTDFFNIYKPRGSEEGGGGQSYIDVPTEAVSEREWKKFFKGIRCKNLPSGPSWHFKINSVGLRVTQPLLISQRRPQTFSIRNQKISSRESMRVKAWHPTFGFPKPKNPAKREDIKNLCIYIARTKHDEFWAGWFQNTLPYTNEVTKNALAQMLDPASSAGFIDMSKLQLYIDTSDWHTPFNLNGGKAQQFLLQKATQKTILLSRARSGDSTTQEKEPYSIRAEKEILQDLFLEDENYKAKKYDKKKQEVIRKVLNRNRRAVKLIKELYGRKCQISGRKYIFLKRDGSPYIEAHHLIPLGEGGADSPYNLVVVNPLIHRMLHYAEVSDINLAEIKKNKLTIKINGRLYRITWLREHADRIKDSDKKR